MIRTKGWAYKRNNYLQLTPSRAELALLLVITLDLSRNSISHFSYKFNVLIELKWIV